MRGPRRLPWAVNRLFFINEKGLFMGKKGNPDGDIGVGKAAAAATVFGPALAGVVKVLGKVIEVTTGKK